MCPSRPTMTSCVVPAQWVMMRVSLHWLLRCVYSCVKNVQLHLDDVGTSVRVQTTRFDRGHGSAYDAWVAMGAPQHILPADLDVLRRQMELDMSVQRVATPGNTLEWTVEVQPFGVTLLEIRSYR